jgi:hypothetical protein
MAAARQKEMKDSMTVVATTTFTVAERCSDGTKRFLPDRPQQRRLSH